MMEKSGAWRWVIWLRSRVGSQREAWARLLDARLSIVPVALGVLILAFPQGRDVVRDLVDLSTPNHQDLDGKIPTSLVFATDVRWACFLGACLWSGIVAWYWPHLLTLSRTADAEPVWFRVLRRLLGTMPVLAGTITIGVTGQADFFRVWGALTLFAACSVILPILFVYRLALTRRFLAKSWWRKPSCIMGPLLVHTGGRPDPQLTRGDDAFILASFGWTLVVLVLFMVPGLRTEFAVDVGAASIAFGAVGSMISTFSAIVWLLSGSRLPVITLGAVLVLVCSVFNDNHVLSRVPPDPAAHQIGVQAAYDAWARQNPDGPLILVATAGGASRAAYWTSAVFRALDDRTNGRFASQVFAISSVSGGTLGAFGYAAWIADHPAGSSNCPYSALKRRDFDRKFVGGDYLSPAIGGMLYPDLVQQFSPIPLFPDRARSIEESWERGWADAVALDRSCGGKADPASFAEDYRKIWDTSLSGRGPWVPIVLANGTLVEDGKRIITAPVAIEAPVFEDSHDFFARFGGPVSMATAVLNSARFPIVSPAGTVPAKGGGTYHIVDGGYFENGGLETIYDVARYLQTIVQGKRPILIIEINNDDAAVDSDLARYPNNYELPRDKDIALRVAIPAGHNAEPAEGATAVLGAFYNTRSSRGVLGAKRLSSLSAVGLTNMYRATFNLDPLLKGRKTAMSWSISASSRLAMDDALQAMGPWLNAAESKRVRDAQAGQAQLGQDIGCELAMADQIAATIGATVPAAPVNCLDKDIASRVGIPLGLGKPKGR